MAIPAARFKAGLVPLEQPGRLVMSRFPCNRGGRRGNRNL